MKKLCLSLVVLQLSAASLFAAGEVVQTVSEDWADPAGSGWTIDGWESKALETADPGGMHTFIDVGATHGLTGQWLFATESSGMSFTATKTLSGVPAFDNISIDQFVIGAGGGIDANHFDGVSLSINGDKVMDLNIHGRNSDDDRWAGSYGASAPGAAVTTIATNDSDGGEFFSERTNGWGHDTLYDVGLDPNFQDIAVSGAGDVTIMIEGRLTNGEGAMEGAGDEQIGVANMTISFANQVPEPSSLLLLASGVGVVMSLLRRRR